MLTNAEGSINLQIGTFYQEEGSFIYFGCSFQASAVQSFLQYGQVLQNIYSINRCRALAIDDTDRRDSYIGYFVEAYTVTASGWFTMSIILQFFV